MRNVMSVCGVPGTGKTTLFREFMKNYTWERVEPVKLLTAEYCKELDLFVLGKYDDGEVFAGTDKLSMAVMPVAIEWMSTHSSNVLFEGDRLGSNKFLSFLSELPDTILHILILSANNSTLLQRYAERGSDQSETFLKAKDTKISNINGNFELMEYITEFKNENIDDQLTILNKINSIFN
jgi:broad-specificity NMP kinase